MLGQIREVLQNCFMHKAAASPPQGPRCQKHGLERKPLMSARPLRRKFTHVDIGLSLTAPIEATGRFFAAPDHVPL